MSCGVKAMMTSPVVPAAMGLGSVALNSLAFGPLNLAVMPVRSAVPAFRRRSVWVAGAAPMTAFPMRVKPVPDSMTVSRSITCMIGAGVSPSPVSVMSYGLSSASLLRMCKTARWLPTRLGVKRRLIQFLLSKCQIEGLERVEGSSPTMAKSAASAPSMLALTPSSVPVPMLCTMQFMEE